MIDIYLKRHRERLEKKKGKQAFSKAEVARQLGVGRSYITRIESGNEKPSKEFLLRISSLYELDEDRTLLVGGYVPDEIARKVLISKPYWELISALAASKDITSEDLLDIINTYKLDN